MAYSLLIHTSFLTLMLCKEADMSRSNLITTVKWLAAVLIPLGIQLLPTSENFSVPMREFLVSTVFVILLAAFELLPNMLVGLLLPVVYVVTGTVPVANALGI